MTNRKPLTETTRVTISIDGGPYTSSRGAIIAQVVQAILSHGYLAAQVTELDRNDEAAAITLENKDVVYDDNGMIVYEKEAEGGAETAGPGPAVSDVLKAMAPEPEPTEATGEADDCDCPACQIRRMIEAQQGKQDTAEGEPRVRFYLATRYGLLPF